MSEKATTAIYFLGGSTMQGPGVRDEDTVASQTMRKLRQFGITNIEAVNFGQPAYVINQEIIELVNQLRRGNLPKVVVFYDGLNEVLSTLAHGRAGLSGGEGHLVGFHKDAVQHLKERSVFELLERHSGIFRLINSAKRKWLGESGKSLPTDPLAKTTPLEHLGARPPTEELVKQIHHNYLEAVHFARKLGQKFGFETYFFLQPTLQTKHPLSDREQEIWRLVESTSEGKVVNERAHGWNALLDKVTHAPYDDLRPLLNRNLDTHFWDVYGHLTKGGNEIVAEKIAQTLARRSQVLPRNISSLP